MAEPRGVACVAFECLFRDRLVQQHEETLSVRLQQDLHVRRSLLHAEVVAGGSTAAPVADETGGDANGMFGAPLYFGPMKTNPRCKALCP